MKKIGSIKKRMGKRILRTAAALMAALMTGGCIAAEPAAPTPTPTPEVEEVLQTDGEFRLGVDVPLYGVNPLASRSDAQQSICSLVYEGLVRKDETGKPVPCLAESWALKPSDQCWCWEFQLRNNIAFHKGGLLSAHDVQATLNALLGQMGSMPDLPEEEPEDRERDPDQEAVLSQTPTLPVDMDNNCWSAAFRQIIAVDVPSENVLRIFTTNPDYGLLQALDFPILKMADVQALLSGRKDLVPNGTGPYACTAAGRDLWKLEAFDGWWRGKANAQNVTVTRFSDTEKLRTAFKKGEIDAAITDEIDLTPYTMTGVDGAAEDYPLNSLSVLLFNFDHPWLSNSDFRLGMAYAIDAKKIASVVYRNRVCVLEGLIPQGNWLFSDQHRLYESGTDAAEQCFDRIGYRTGSITEPLVLLACQNVYDVTEVLCARELADQLQAAGIPVTLQVEPSDTYRRRLEERDYDMALASYTADGTQNWKFAFDEESEMWCGLTSERLNEAVSAVLEQKDEEGFKAAVQKMESVFLSETPFISLFYRSHSLVTRSDVARESGRTRCRDAFNGLETWARRVDPSELLPEMTEPIMD